MKLISNSLNNLVKMLIFLTLLKRLWPVDFNQRVVVLQSIGQWWSREGICSRFPAHPRAKVDLNQGRRQKGQKEKTFFARHRFTSTSKFKLDFLKFQEEWSMSFVFLEAFKWSRYNLICILRSVCMENLKFEDIWSIMIKFWNRTLILPNQKQISKLSFLSNALTIHKLFQTCVHSPGSNFKIHLSVPN